MLRQDWPATLEAEGLAFDRIDEMNYRVRFDRTQVSTAELIRKVLAGAEVRDLLIEDEPIEEIIKRIYAGEAGLEAPVGIEENLVSARTSALAPYLEFSRIGFVNILAFRLRYYTGILTYLINVTVYYFIWSAVYKPQGVHAGVASINMGGYNLPQMLTYVSVGWILRSFYWNTIDQEMAYEVIEGKIAMDLIKPVSVQWMWIWRAMGESAFRLAMLTAPTAILIMLIFPVLRPASWSGFAMFLVGAVGSFLLMGAINFMIGTCAIPLKSILALIRAKYWLIELLSGLLVPITMFPKVLQKVMALLPFEHIAFTPLQIYLGKISGLAGRKGARHSVAVDRRAAVAWLAVVEPRYAENYDSWRIDDEAPPRRVPPAGIPAVGIFPAVFESACQLPGRFPDQRRDKPGGINVCAWLRADSDHAHTVAGRMDHSRNYFSVWVRNDSVWTLQYSEPQSLRVRQRLHHGRKVRSRVIASGELAVSDIV